MAARLINFFALDAAKGFRPLPQKGVCPHSLSGTGRTGTRGANVKGSEASDNPSLDEHRQLKNTRGSPSPHASVWGPENIFSL